MKHYTGLLLIVALVSAQRDVQDDDGKDNSNTDLKDVHIRPQFASHIRKFPNSRQQTRTNEEVKIRFRNFKKSAEIIKEHNKKGTRFRMGENEFMTMTRAEMKLRTGLANVTATVHKRSLSFKSRLQLRETAPETFDHRDYDRVSEVVDQGDCGSCWAFSAAYPLEAAIAMLSDKPAVALSVQQILSCTYEDDASYNGCNGGWYHEAWKDIKDSGHLATDADMPYLSLDMTCEPSFEKLPNALKDYTLVGWDRVPEGDDSKLQLFASKHVLSVAVDSLGLFFYQRGIFEDPWCTKPANVDHAVTLVGYDTESWIIKNSWDATWGEQGYFRMTRQLENHCGVSDYAYFPILEKKNAKRTPVEEVDEDGNRKTCYYY